MSQPMVILPLYCVCSVYTVSIKTYDLTESDIGADERPQTKGALILAIIFTNNDNTLLNILTAKI